MRLAEIICSAREMQTVKTSMHDLSYVIMNQWAVATDIDGKYHEMVDLERRARRSR